MNVILWIPFHRHHHHHQFVIDIYYNWLHIDVAYQYLLQHVSRSTKDVDDGVRLSVWERRLVDCNPLYIVVGGTPSDPPPLFSLSLFLSFFFTDSLSTKAQLVSETRLICHQVYIAVERCLYLGDKGDARYLTNFYFCFGIWNKVGFFYHSFSSFHFEQTADRSIGPDAKINSREIGNPSLWLFYRS